MQQSCNLLVYRNFLFTPGLRFKNAMAQPKAKAKPAGAGVQAACKHKGKLSQHKGSQKPASDADAKAIQLLLAR